MIPKYRTAFNSLFSEEKYELLKQKVETKSNQELQFRISESPIFLPLDFKNKLEEVSRYIIDKIISFPPETYFSAVPEKHRVANENSHPHFLIFDFGICKDENNEISPQLIELQAFPSLYSFMEILKESYVEIYPFLEELNSGFSRDNYFQKLKQVLLAEENPRNTILLEIFPENQKTNIDFKITEQIFGIPTVCVTQLFQEGKNLFYQKNSQKIQVHRIYNRMIFEELDKYENLNLKVDFSKELNVKWITHPNLFYTISKFLLPKFNHQFIPKSYFLNEFPKLENLENYVLKPLFSFGGEGVNLNPSLSDLNSINDKLNYILQKKVSYEPLFLDVNGDLAKAEIRLMFIWDEKEDYPECVMNLVRMTKSDLANMNFVDEKVSWVGCSFAFFNIP